MDAAAPARKRPAVAKLMESGDKIKEVVRYLREMGKSWPAAENAARSAERFLKLIDKAIRREMRKEGEGEGTKRRRKPRAQHGPSVSTARELDEVSVKLTSELSSSSGDYGWTPDQPFTTEGTPAIGLDVTPSVDLLAVSPANMYPSASNSSTENLSPINWPYHPGHIYLSVNAPPSSPASDISHVARNANTASDMPSYCSGGEMSDSEMSSNLASCDSSEENVGNLLDQYSAIFRGTLGAIPGDASFMDVDLDALLADSANPIWQQHILPFEEGYGMGFGNMDLSLGMAPARNSDPSQFAATNTFGGLNFGFAPGPADSSNIQQHSFTNSSSNINFGYAKENNATQGTGMNIDNTGSDVDWSEWTTSDVEDPSLALYQSLMAATNNKILFQS